VCGDIILGAPSCAVTDLDAYFNTLARLMYVKVDWLLLPHSVSLESPDFIKVKAKKKISAYMEYRV